MQLIRSFAMTLLGFSFTGLAACACDGSKPPSHDPDGTLESAPIGNVTLPPVNGKFDYQLGGPYTPAAGVDIVDRDRTAEIRPGVYVEPNLYNICYVNALQTQPDTDGVPAADQPYGTTSWWERNHPELLVHDAAGKVVEDPDWHEGIFDVKTQPKRDALLAIQRPWILGCQQHGFQAVEPDNLDSYMRPGAGFEFSADVAYLTDFAAYAHSLGLAVAQKNGSGDVTPEIMKQVGFDFAIAEECQARQARDKECDSYTDLYGAHAIEIEYDQASFNAACTARGSNISIILRDKEVVPANTADYVYKDC